MPEPLPFLPSLEDLPHAERRELDAMDPTIGEVEWAIREAYVVDPGTDTPAAKLLQRRRSARQADVKATADAAAESPLRKFERVWA